jgi:cbb3-type cytochrome oxidase maturation protein
MSLSSLLFLLGLTVVFVGLAAFGILWAIKSGQYDDMDGPAQRILMDDDDPMIPFNRLKQTGNQNRIESDE